MRTRSLSALLLSLLLVAPASAQEKSKLPTIEELDAQVADVWYGIYISGRKSGWSHVTFAKGGTPEAPTYVSRSETRFEGVVMGQRFQLEQHDQNEFDARPPFALLRVRERTKQDAERLEREVERRGEVLHMAVKTDGEVHEVDLAIPEYGLAEEMASTLWILRGPATGEKLDFVTLDLDEGELRKKTSTVTAVETKRVEGIETRIYRLVDHDELEGEEGTSVVDARGTLLSAAFDGMFELRLEPEEVAKRLDVGGDLFVDGLAKVDKPLGDTEKLSRLRLRVEGEAKGELPAGPGQRVERDGDAVVLVLETGAAPMPATPEETQRWLKATPDVPADHPEVARLAREAVGDAATPAAKVERLVHFVSEFIEDTYGANAISVLDVIRKKRGDCSEHADLFTALARAAGIPARTVGGLGYMGDEERSFGGHAWNEVVLDGVWVPVDPTWDQARADVGHVRLGHDGGPDVAGKVYGRLRFVLLEAR